MKHQSIHVALLFIVSLLLFTMDVGSSLAACGVEERLIDHHYIGACGHTDISTFSLTEAADITKIRIWYDTDIGGDTVSAYLVGDNDYVNESGPIEKGACQWSWCEAIWEINDVLEPGEYMLIADSESICLDPSGATTLVLFGCDADDVPPPAVDGIDPPHTVTLIDETSSPADAPVYMGPMTIQDGLPQLSGEMQLSINFPAYNAPVDLWCVVFLPDGRSVVVDSTGTLRSLETDGFPPLAQGVSGTPISQQVLTSFNVNGSALPSLFEPWPEDGLWSVYWLIAPTASGDIMAAIDNGAYDLGYYVFEVKKDFIRIDPTRTVYTSTTLPTSSPLILSNTQVDMYNDSYALDATGSTDMTLPAEFSVDTTIMLPAREQDPYPVVYLFTTVLPNEIEVQINAEETAVSLLMDSITKDYLVKAGTPEEVKTIIRQEGITFINRFKTMLENDPYTLALDNLDNVYDQTYIDAADACRNALENASRTVTRRAVFDTTKKLSGSLLDVTPNQLQYDFSVYENTVGSLGFFLWKFPDFDFENATGKVDGKLIIENDTMLFNYYKVTDLLTSIVLQDYPKTGQTNPALAVLELMADKNIIGPQKDWMHAWWASTAKYDAYYQPVKIEIATPSVTSEDDTMLHNALAFRTAFALFSNLLAQIIPPDIADVIDDSSGKFLGIAKYLLELGAMDTALDKIGDGEYQAAIEEILLKLSDKTIMDKVWEKILNKQGTHLADKSVQKMLGRYYTKFGKYVKKFPITKIGLAVDLASLLNDYATIPSNIYFDKINFPFYIDNVGPNPLPKVGKDETLPKITVTGMGLNSVLFDGVSYSPEIYIEAKDIDDKNQTITIDEESIHPQSDGSLLWFELPREWAEIGSPIVGPLYISVEHHFIDPHGVDELITLELPDGANSSIEAAHKELMKVNFNIAVSLSGFNKEKVTRGEAVNVYGQGFTTWHEDNHLYFTDHTGNTVEASIDWGNDKYLETTIPNDLEIGPLTVEVRLYDKPEFKSNRLTIPLIPKSVTVDPAEYNVNFEDSIVVSLSQEEGYDIYYSIDTTDSASIQPYNGPITLSNTAKIFPFAREIVNGINYDSMDPGYLFYKCSENESFEDGVCTSVPDVCTSLPDVMDMSCADAEQAMRNAGFDVEVSSIYYNTVPAGQVIIHDPPEGCTVRIVCSLGTQPRFIDNGDGTVTDSRSSRMWSKNADHGAMMKVDAQNYCDSLTLGGHNDWILPGSSDLQDQLDIATQSPELFNNVHSDYYWVAVKTYSGEIIYAVVKIGQGWVEALGENNDYVNNENQKYHVWPVRIYR